MSKKETERLKYLGMVSEGMISLKQASMLMGVSYRHSKRIMKRFKEEGEKGLIHKLRGKTSKRKTDDSIIDKICSLYAKLYPDFSIALFHEKLSSIHNINISRETVRTILKNKDLYKTRRRKKNKSVHIFRERKQHKGELIQIDGSTHKWLEDRYDKKLTLMGYIDDATGEVFARFYDYEGVYPFLDSFIEFTKQYGLPKSIYTDRHSTYMTTRKPSIEEQLENKRPKTQVETILDKLRVKFIHAYSPQAKGRVERLFETLQDRLIKEMRLENIKTKEDANRFLEEYLPIFNKRFTKTPKSNLSYFRSLDKDFDYEWEFALESIRTVNNDHTIRFKGRLLQIKDIYSVRRKQKVLIKESIYGNIRVFYKDKELKIKEIEKEAKTETNKTKKADKPLSCCSKNISCSFSLSMNKE